MFTEAISSFIDCVVALPASFLSFLPFFPSLSPSLFLSFLRDNFCVVLAILELRLATNSQRSLILTSRVLGLKWVPHPACLIFLWSCNHSC